MHRATAERSFRSPGAHHGHTWPPRRSQRAPRAQAVGHGHVPGRGGVSGHGGTSRRNASLAPDIG